MVHVGNRLLLFLIHIISLLPMRVLYGISDLLYYGVHYVARYRLEVVRKNLEHSFPDKSVAERRRIENRFYRYLCDLIVEIVKAHSMKPEEMARRVTFSGLTEAEATFATHDFCFCYLGHYGNWEWMISVALHQQHGGRMAQIYHPLRNKTFNDWFLDNRARFGGVNIPMKQTLRKLLQLRDEMHREGATCPGYLLGCIADQVPKQENIHHTVNFLNQQTAVFTGSEKIGKMLNASFVYSRITRPKRGYYHCTFELMTTDPKSVPDFELTDDYMRRFEADVRECPELWLWTHDRWKR